MRELLQLCRDRPVQFTMLTPLSASKWNESTAAHLLNRAAFGGTPGEIEATRRKGLTFAIRDLVDVSSDGGTDHGAAAPMFVLGGLVKAGLLGNT